MTAAIALSGHYDYRLVALSVAISLLAAYAALDLAERVSAARGRAQLGWLVGGASAMGTGIWAMHYVGMVAFHLPVQVFYDWPTVLVSLFAAIVASGCALFVVSRAAMGLARAIGGSLLMGFGIAGMHYIGMEAMRLKAMCVYSPWRVALSVVLAVAISFVAIELTFARREDQRHWGWPRVGSALVMGLAIPVMHYSGMAAVTFLPDPAMAGDLTHAISISGLRLASISLATLIILMHVSLISTIDRRGSLQTRQMMESESQLRAVFDSLSEGIMVLDRDLNLLRLNRTAARLIGSSGQTDSLRAIPSGVEAFSLDGTPIAQEALPSALARQAIFVQNLELRLRLKATGETAICEVNTAPIEILPGVATQILISLRDITESRRIREAQSQLAAIVASSEDAIIGKDLDGIVTSWNAGAEKMFGYTAAEMLGTNIRLLLPAGREHEEDGILNRIRRGDNVKHFETLRKRKDGQVINVSLSISPIRNSAGNVVGASKIARNITDKKQMERQLHQSQKMEAVGQLTGGVAHDFNNLLGVIVGNLDLLERMMRDNEPALKRIQTAQKAAARGAGLTRRMLAFSSKEDLNPAPVRLEESIQNLIELAGRALGPEIKITTRIDKSMPPVFVDVAGLENALLNLAVNARDAMPRGGSLIISTCLSELEASYPPVSAGELMPGTYACISVSDTGHGMSPETLERAFEPFFTTKPRHKGTGLGLAMVYGFARKSGGTARLYSEQEHGTTVSLYLPLVDHKPPSPVPVAVKTAAPSAKTGTILLVDDELPLLEIAHAYLTDMGYSVIQAEDGPSALEAAAQCANIDLMITDVIMPGGMNGVELAQRIRRMNPGTRIIFTSGFPADALEERSGTRVDGPLLHKPYQRSEFAAMIQRTLEEPVA